MAASVHCMRKVTVTRYTNVFLGRVAPKRVCVGEDKREDVETKQSVEGAGRRREEAAAEQLFKATRDWKRKDNATKANVASSTQG